MSARRGRKPVEVLPPEASTAMTVFIDASSCQVAAASLRAQMLPHVLTWALQRLWEQACAGHYEAAITLESMERSRMGLMLDELAEALLKRGFLVKQGTVVVEKLRYQVEMQGLMVSWRGGRPS